MALRLLGALGGAVGCVDVVVVDVVLVVVVVELVEVVVVVEVVEVVDVVDVLVVVEVLVVDVVVVVVVVLVVVVVVVVLVVVGGGSSKISISTINEPALSAYSKSFTIRNRRPAQSICAKKAPPISNMQPTSLVSSSFPNKMPHESGGLGQSSPHISSIPSADTGGPSSIS